ncbi:MAG: DUF456 domain-containing protein [Candidatus Moranbacteria bacterium]|nr:DUF456 domain-containing protein [Candidatus Moranbacteria bacterium]
MEIAVIVIVWLLIFVGLVGTIVPILPGMVLVFGGILLHALYFGVETVGLTTLTLLGVALALSFVIDILASLYGAKRFGATRYGIWGSTLGGLLGLLLLSLPGLFVGIFLGAVLGEYFWGKKKLEEALHAGIGSVLGFLGGTVLKFLLAIAMVIVFVVKVWF